MTKTEHLQLYTWEKTDGVDVGQISSNFSALDTAVHRADNCFLLATALAPSDGTTLTATLDAWPGNAFARLDFRYSMLVSSVSGTGAYLQMQVGGSGNSSASWNIGPCNHTDSRDFLITGHGSLYRVADGFWDMDHTYTMGLGTNLFTNQRGLTRLQFSGDPTKLSLLLSLDEGSSQPVFRTGATLQVFAAI